MPAMCDGVTQGQDGMELSLFSRDVIAMSTAIALSHNMFDGALYLGICDKIVPGLMISALSFGHLPAVFRACGSHAIIRACRTACVWLFGKPMRRVKWVNQSLLRIESASYHSAGTCTFCATATVIRC